MADVAHPKGHQVAAPQFAVQTQVEQRQFSTTLLQLQSSSDRPDVLWTQRRFLSYQLALVPGLRVLGCVDGFLDGLLSLKKAARFAPPLSQPVNATHRPWRTRRIQIVAKVLHTVGCTRPLPVIDERQLTGTHTGADPRWSALHLIQRTAHPTTSAVEHTGVDHGCGHVAVAEQLLHRSDVVAGVQQQMVANEWRSTCGEHGLTIVALSPEVAVLMQETRHFASLWNKMALRLGLKSEFLAVFLSYSQAVPSQWTSHPAAHGPRTARPPYWK